MLSCICATLRALEGTDARRVLSHPVRAGSLLLTHSLTRGVDAADAEMSQVA